MLLFGVCFILYFLNLSNIFGDLSELITNSIFVFNSVFCVSPSIQGLYNKMDYLYFIVSQEFRFFRIHIPSGNSS